VGRVIEDQEAKESKAICITNNITNKLQPQRLHQMFKIVQVKITDQ
jgi:hypothetical protein